MSIKKFKYFFTIGFFPIVIFYKILKLIIRKIYNRKLKKYISTISIEKIDSLQGIDFEELLNQTFRANGIRSYKTKKSHDYGADIIVEYRHKKIAIQCKLYYKHLVNNSAVQEVRGAQEYYNTNHSVVITNSYFTKPAINLAKASHVVLIDRENLIKILSGSKGNIIDLLSL